MLQRFLLLILLLPVLTLSCKRIKKSEQEVPVARVFNYYLFKSDLDIKIPEGVAEDDSIRIARRLIEEWVREKLLLVNAEQYLSAEQKDVEKQIEEYRSSLLIFKYKQKLLSQNLDTAVSDQELQSYYEQNSSNYILDSDVVKVNYIKLPVSAPQISDVRRWYRSVLPEDLDLLEKYCVTFADHYLINSEKWFRFTSLIESTPLKLSNPGSYLNYNRNIEVSDSLFFYFIHIIDRVEEGQVSPLDLVKDDIRSVIINKRKIRFMQDLENTVYNDGRSKNKVEIF